ncbi:nitric oxide-sensing protein NosP [Azospirillum griseum]|uniref:FIST domain containing protein n=1 Tax=Azospirillum griseum TaxID=2496639 RepID=A0A431VE45_9PROT|nr:nitric oxide-sensing protein NosP [Azospirillum griseum]RTR17574.1 FIST domain containing protein [Azospirillum griseum]
MVAFTRPRNRLSRRHPWSTLAEPPPGTDAPAPPPASAPADGTTTHAIPRAVSQAEDPGVAARELRDGLGDGLELVVVFCAPSFDRDALAGALTAAFGTIPVIGCTTAGEIGPFGYLSGALVAVGFPSEDFSVVTALVDPVDRFEIADSTAIVQSLLERRDHALADRAVPLGEEADSFAMLLIDGLSMSEETVVSALHNALITIPLFGASAGDDLHFERSFVLHEGRFRSNAAVVALFTTARPFTVFHTQHFVRTDRKMVVTGADPQRRIVTEINAEPAGPEYARLVGLEGETLTPMIFASHPVVVRVGGEYHVRSIQKVNDDESLTFFCAIDEGIVLTVAEGVDPVANFDALMSGIVAEVGSPDLVLGCDCILRRLEMEQRQLGAVMSQRLASHRVVGFCAYGEQVNGMHVNQTFTGVAIGARPV